MKKEKKLIDYLSAVSSYKKEKTEVKSAAVNSDSITFNSIRICLKSFCHGSYLPLVCSTDLENEIQGKCLTSVDVCLTDIWPTVLKEKKKKKKKLVWALFIF